MRGGLGSTPDASQSTFTLDKYAITANGSDTATATGTIKNSAGVALSNVAVTTTATACTVDGTASTLISSLTAVANTDVTFTVTLRDVQTGAAIPNIAVANISVNGGSGATISSFSGSTDANGQVSGLIQWSSNGAKSMTCAVLPSGANVSITGWTCTVSGAAATYPNEPAGLTLISSTDGTVRASSETGAQGSGHAFGFSWMNGWFWDSSRTEDEAIVVVTDATNPTGSGSSLQLNWLSSLDVPAIKAAKTDPATMPSTYSTLYIMVRMYWVSSWATAGHKFFYIGLPTSDKHIYVTREPSTAWGKATTEGWAGAGGNIIVLPDNSFTDNAWNSVEFVFHKQSSAGVHDGAMEWYNNGSLIGSATGINWNDAGFGTFEWYGTSNTIDADRSYRIGEIYMSGA